MDKTRRKFSAPDPQQRKENLRVFLYALVGLVITIASFILHHHFRDFVFTTVLICVTDIVYTYWNTRMFLRWLKKNSEKNVVIPLFMLAYWALLFASICAFNGIILKGPFLFTFFLYPIFLMPAFIIEILLAGLILEYM